MTCQLPKDIIDKIIDGPEPSGSDPFLRRDGRVYLRFDEQHLYNNPDKESEITMFMDYFWRNQKVFRMHVKMDRLSSGTVLIVNGIEGEMAVELL